MCQHKRSEFDNRSQKEPCGRSDMDEFVQGDDRTLQLLEFFHFCLSDDERKSKTITVQ